MLKLFKNIFGEKREKINTENLHYISFWTAGLNYESRGANALKCHMHEKVWPWVHCYKHEKVWPLVHCYKLEKVWPWVHCYKHEIGLTWGSTVMLHCVIQWIPEAYHDFRAWNVSFWKSEATFQNIYWTNNETWSKSRVKKLYFICGHMCVKK